MAMPSKATLLNIDFSFRGQPFVEVPASDQYMMGFEFTFRGTPLVGAVGVGGSLFWSQLVNTEVV